jgi:integrase
MTTPRVQERDGKFVIDYRHHEPDGTTRRVRVTVPADRTSEKDRARFLREKLAELAAGTFKTKREQKREARAEAPSPTIKAYAETYVRAHSVSRGLKASSIKSKRSMLANWIVPVLGDRRVEDIRTADFTKLRMAMHDDDRKGKTINNVLVVLSSLVRFWYEQHDKSPPPFKVGLVKLPRSTRAPYFEEEDLSLLVDAAWTMGSQAALLVMFGGDAGLRLSECRALRWSDLQLRGRAAVTVSRTREDGEGDGDEDEEHSPKGWDIRTIPLTERLVEALREMPRGIRDDHVFLTDDEPLTRRMVSRKFETIRKKAGLKDGTFHWLRHTFCTHLAARGRQPGEIQKLAGHADITTTMKYIHVMAGAVDDAIASLARPLRGQKLVKTKRGRSRTAP